MNFLTFKSFIRTNGSNAVKIYPTSGDEIFQVCSRQVRETADQTFVAPWDLKLDRAMQMTIVTTQIRIMKNDEIVQPCFHANLNIVPNNCVDTIKSKTKRYVYV